MDKLALFLLAVLAFTFTVGVVLWTFIFAFVFTLGVGMIELVALWAFVYKEEKAINHVKTAMAGIILLAGDVIVTLLWIWYLGPVFLIWYWSKQISELTMNILNTLVGVLSFALSIAGLALYMLGKKAFWKTDRRIIERMLSAIIGATLTIMGVWFFWATIYFRSYIFFIISLLWFIPGIKLLSDTVTANF